MAFFGKKNNRGSNAAEKGSGQVGFQKTVRKPLKAPSVQTMVAIPLVAPAASSVADTAKMQKTWNKFKKIQLSDRQYDKITRWADSFEEDIKSSRTLLLGSVIAGSSSAMLAAGSSYPVAFIASGMIGLAVRFATQHHGDKPRSSKNLIATWAEPY